MKTRTKQTKQDKFIQQLNTRKLPPPIPPLGLYAEYIHDGQFMDCKRHLVLEIKANKLLGRSGFFDQPEDDLTPDQHLMLALADEIYRHQGRDPDCMIEPSQITRSGMLAAACTGRA